MTLDNLENAIRHHSGEFICELIHGKTRKTIGFKHVITPPEVAEGVPDVGRLREFYKTFGSVLFYYDEVSKDAAKYLAPVAQWNALRKEFTDWLEDLDDGEQEEFLPDWIESCLVVGETPQSGNYILIATEGPAGGRVFEFEHDGFEFIEQARDIVKFTEKLLKPNSAKLTDMASHMRFVEDDWAVQWWICEMHDNNRHHVATKT